MDRRRFVGQSAALAAAGMRADGSPICWRARERHATERLGRALHLHLAGRRHVACRFVRSKARGSSKERKPGTDYDVM